MVVLNKIYTKTGDAGTTALGNGTRVENMLCGSTLTAQWTKPTPRLAWHGNMRRVTWMRNWPPYKTTCSIWAQISAGQIWKKTLRRNINHCA